MRKVNWAIVNLVVVSAFGIVTPAQAEVKTGVFGFGNIDLRVGNREGAANGEDSLGVGPLAIGVKAEEENVSFVGVIGASALSTDSAASPNPYMAIRDAFITISEISGSPVSLSAGPQALLFGLKSNGFPGDRSIRASVEFGGGAGTGANAPFAVSQQGHAAVRAWYELFDKKAKLIAGVFDTNTNTVTAQPAAKTEGSKVTNNYFVAFRTDDLGVDGLYSFVGFENRYVATATEKGSKPVVNAGAGFKQNLFDISAEWFSLDKSVAGTTDNETYIVTELTVFPMEKTGVYVDYATAQKLEAATTRIGFFHQISSLLTAQVEWSHDKTKNDLNNVEGMDFRLHASF